MHRLRYLDTHRRPGRGRNARLDGRCTVERKALGDREKMAPHTRCLLCENPGTLAEAVDIGKVPCNVRQFQDHMFTLWRCTGCGSLHCAEDADLALYYAEYPLKHQKIGFGERIGYGNRLRLIKRQGFRDSDRILD